MFVVLKTETPKPKVRCWGANLGDLSSKSTMQRNGWAFKNKNSKLDSRFSFEDECRTATFYEPTVAIASATLYGAGSATLDFGNCAPTGKVEVVLSDGKQVQNITKVSDAQGSEKRKRVEFNFQGGSILKITTDFGIVSLNSVDIVCEGIIINILFLLAFDSTI